MKNKKYMMLLLFSSLVVPRQQTEALLVVSKQQTEWSMLEENGVNNLAGNNLVEIDADFQKLFQYFIDTLNKNQKSDTNASIENPENNISIDFDHLIEKFNVTTKNFSDTLKTKSESDIIIEKAINDQAVEENEPKKDSLNDVTTKINAVIEEETKRKIKLFTQLRGNDCITEILNLMDTIGEIKELKEKPRNLASEEDHERGLLGVQASATHFIPLMGIISGDVSALFKPLDMYLDGKDLVDNDKLIDNKYRKERKKRDELRAKIIKMPEEIKKIFTFLKTAILPTNLFALGTYLQKFKQELDSNNADNFEKQKELFYKLFADPNSIINILYEFLKEPFSEDQKVNSFFQNIFEIIKSLQVKAKEVAQDVGFMETDQKYRDFKRNPIEKTFNEFQDIGELKELYEQDAYFQVIADSMTLSTEDFVKKQETERKRKQEEIKNGNEQVISSDFIYDLSTASTRFSIFSNDFKKVMELDSIHFKDTNINILGYLQSKFKKLEEIEENFRTESSSFFEILEKDRLITSRLIKKINKENFQFNITKLYNLANKLDSDIDLSKGNIQGLQNDIQGKQTTGLIVGAGFRALSVGFMVAFLPNPFTITSLCADFYQMHKDYKKRQQDKKNLQEIINAINPIKESMKTILPSFSPTNLWRLGRYLRNVKWLASQESPEPQEKERVTEALKDHQKNIEQMFIDKNSPFNMIINFINLFCFDVVKISQGLSRDQITQIQEQKTYMRSIKNTLEGLRNAAEGVNKMITHATESPEKWSGILGQWIEKVYAINSKQSEFQQKLSKLSKSGELLNKIENKNELVGLLNKIKNEIEESKKDLKNIPYISEFFESYDKYKETKSTEDKAKELDKTEKKSFVCASPEKKDGILQSLDQYKDIADLPAYLNSQSLITLIKNFNIYANRVVFARGISGRSRADFNDYRQEVCTYTPILDKIIQNSTLKEIVNGIDMLKKNELDLVVNTQGLTEAMKPKSKWNPKNWS